VGNAVWLADLAVAVAENFASLRVIEKSRMRFVGSLNPNALHG
jgi:hypothetical protein